MINIEKFGPGYYSGHTEDGFDISLRLVQATKRMERHYKISIGNALGEDALKGLVDPDDRYGLTLGEAKARAQELLEVARKGIEKNKAVQAGCSTLASWTIPLQANGLTEDEILARERVVFGLGIPSGDVHLLRAVIENGSWAALETLLKNHGDRATAAILQAVTKSRHTYAGVPRS